MCIRDRYLTTIQIPCNWNPDLTLDDAPLFQSFLNHLTSGNDEDQTTLLEIIGLIVSNVNGYRFKKLLILHGPTDGGKSTFRQILIDLIGEENSHSLDIKQLNDCLLYTSFALILIKALPCSKYSSCCSVLNDRKIRNSSFSKRD